MNILDKPFDAISEADIQNLFDNEVREDLRIEYKRQLPGGGTADRKDFLYEIAAFANTAGGLIVYGVEDEKGAPKALPGVDVDDPDATGIRLASIVSSGVRPKLHGLRVGFVDAADGRRFVLVHVRRSFNSPHMVTLEKANRFYLRRPEGRKEQMDVDEIRAAVLGAEGVEARARDFRLERLAMIASGQTPVTMDMSVPAIVFHLFPLNPPLQGCDLDRLGETWQFGVPPLWHNMADESRWNLDGQLSYVSAVARNYPHPQEEGELPYQALSYLQVFRAGAIESVDRFRLTPRDGNGWIPEAFEKAMGTTLGLALAVERALAVEPPFVVMASFLGVRGFRMHLDPRGWADRPREEIDRNDLLVPELLLEEYEVTPLIELRPIFDAVWNAGGFRGSPNYNEDGTRREGR